MRWIEPVWESKGSGQQARNGWRRANRTLSFLIAGVVWASPNAQAANDTTVPSVSPAEIIERMVKQNEDRTEHLKFYTALRHYHIDARDLGKTLTADMHAQITYTPGTGKTFQVLDKSGSHLLLDKVLLKLLETERDDSLQKRTALTPANYTFVFQSQTVENGQALYIFAVEPKIKNKLLYCGKLWIDATDYAVVRVDAQPAETPSFWIRSTEIHHTYSKNGQFWLPQTNRSESIVRFGGKAVLTIDYGTYRFDQPQNTMTTTGH